MLLASAAVGTLKGAQRSGCASEALGCSCTPHLCWLMLPLPQSAHRGSFSLLASWNQLCLGPYRVPLPVDVLAVQMCFCLRGSAWGGAQAPGGDFASGSGSGQACALCMPWAVLSCVYAGLQCLGHRVFS